MNVALMQNTILSNSERRSSRLSRVSVTKISKSKNQIPISIMKTPTQIFGQKLTRTLCSLSCGGILLASISEAFPSEAWEALNNSGAPSARYDHTAVWTGNEMIVWGGYGGSPLNTGARYNPTSNIWTPVSTSGAPSARYEHTAVWTGSEMIVWSGHNGSSYVSDGAR